MYRKKILFIHHHKFFGGATRSLYSLIEEAKKKNDVTLLTPNGPVVKYFKKLDIKIIKVSGVPIIDISYSGIYHGARWILLIRELFHFVYFYIEFIVKKQNEKFDIIHINEFLVIPILPLSLIIPVYNNISVKLDKLQHLISKLLFFFKLFSSLLE